MVRGKVPLILTFYMGGNKLVKKTERDLPSFMPKERLTEAQRLQLLEDTKQRLRLEQEARTQARLAELEIEVLENLGRRLLLEHRELSEELECPETSTAKQYTLVTSDNEEDLTDENCENLYTSRYS
jgi:hypothetical protein